MHRRDLLKALAAVPLATAIGGCEERAEKDEKQRGKRTSTLEIHLDGTFAVVLQRNKGNSLLAFSPKPSSGEEQH
ncbi:MAG TPA: twin-arginine translocation signal domain-containing protein, partial [Alphaproteobacteria bacterium]|nr:twin-arginine translocation signal domain-containing protein [Alphaproteobacteria bacterium]